MISLLAIIAVAYLSGAFSVFFMTLGVPTWVWWMAIMLLWVLVAAFVLLRIVNIYRP